MQHLRRSVLDFVLLFHSLKAANKNEEGEAPTPKARTSYLNEKPQHKGAQKSNWRHTSSKSAKGGLFTPRPLLSLPI